MSRLSTVNRRAFVGLTAALFTPAAARARAPRPTNLKEVSDESSGSRLLVGAPDQFGFINAIGVLDGGGSLLTIIETGDSVFNVRTTPNERRVMLELMMASAYLDLDTGDQTTFDDVAQVLMPQPAVDGPSAGSAAHLIAPTFSLDAIVRLDVETGWLTDITTYLQGETQTLIPALAAFGPSGALAGVWTGNNVYLLDPAQPEDALVLNGGDDSLYSTAFGIASNEEWIAYTTYDPGDGLGEVILQSTVDGTVIPVVEGDAWSCVQFIPGDDTSFLLMHDGAIERRSIDDPTAAGERVIAIGSQPLADTVTSADDSKRLVSSRKSGGGPTEWVLLDLEANTGTELPDLSGLDLLPISTWEQEPRHALFGSQPEAFSLDLRPGPLTGLSLETGEVTPLLKDVALDSLVTHSTTADGAWAVLSNHPESPEPGFWVVDLAEGVATAVTSTYAVMNGGCLSPDGKLAAVTGRGEDHESEIFLFDPADPTELNSFGPGVTLTWT